MIERFYSELDFSRMDSATTTDGHVIQGLWNESVPMGTLFIGALKNIQKDTLDLSFDVPMHIKRNLLGLVVCQKCNKSDKVYEIEYGDAPVYITSINGEGDTINSPIYKGKYTAGTCLVGPATYYCDRDKIEF